VAPLLKGAAHPLPEKARDQYISGSAAKTISVGAGLIPNRITTSDDLDARDEKTTRGSGARIPSPQQVGGDARHNLPDLRVGIV
jgi:hypothetical protein